MSFQLNIAPSLHVKLQKSNREEGLNEGRKTREEHLRLKELEELRKSGAVPAMTDEAGKDINPHIPQYIMQVPWYYNSLNPTLKHQRIQKDDEEGAESSSFGKWYKRGILNEPAAKKYRPGACENCGAMTHKKKDCLERPRKLGAKWTGTAIARDEVLPEKDLDLDFESKRDRWNGYNLSEHASIIESYEKLQEFRKANREQKLEEKLMKNAAEEEETEGKAEAEEGEVKKATEDGEGPSTAAHVDSDPESDTDDEDKYVDEIEMPGQKFESDERITVRNLRVREDIAKYLFNLDPNSAYYDPKTRSMRNDPFEDKAQAEKGGNLAFIQFQGDNATRVGGDAREFAKQQLFAWEAADQGTDVHLQADPTKAEMLRKEYQKRKDSLKTTTRSEILERYGGEEHLDAPPKALLLGQGEHYVEYTRQGVVKRGEQKPTVKSCYEEDAHDNNHSSVWGSYWKEGQWGYRCCHSFIRNCYCTGSAGIAAEAAAVMKKEDDSDDDDDDE